MRHRNDHALRSLLKPTLSQSSLRNEPSDSGMDPESPPASSNASVGSAMHPHKAAPPRSHGSAPSDFFHHPLKPESLLFYSQVPLPALCRS